MNLSTHIAVRACFPVLILSPSRLTAFCTRAAHIAITLARTWIHMAPFVLTVNGSADTRSSSIPLCPAHRRVLWPVELEQSLPSVQLQQHRVLV